VINGGRSVAFDHVVQLLGIDTLLDRAPPTLSGGEKQRVAIGRALLSKPRLLLMDEPLASLDTGRRSEILRLIERVRDEFGVNIVYVSHSIGEVSRLADEVVLMNDGKVVACDTTETIFNRADLRPYTGRFEGGALIEAHAASHDMKYFLTTFKFDGGELVAPGVDTQIGARVRIRIRARDVTLATARPKGLSIRNVLEGTVGAIEDRGGAIVEVHVQLAGRELLSRISRQALDEMGLQTGQPVFALIKAIAFDKRSMGFTA
jgi:molybdate transport system ATP-binding protein